MKTINIKLITFAVAAGLFLSACGGGSSSGGTTTPDTPDISTVPQCGSTTPPINVAGETIRKETQDAVVRIWHKADGSKTACMISGTATIL